MSRKVVTGVRDGVGISAPVELPAGLLGVPAPSLPAFARLDGVDIVVITIAEFRDLKALQARSVRTAIVESVKGTRDVPRNLSTVERDLEVAHFLRARFPVRMTVAALHQACVAEFGEARTPSAGRIQTYRSRWRESR